MDVTLNEVKGLSERLGLEPVEEFFAALRMTTPDGRDVECTNVMPSDVVQKIAKGVCS